MTIYGNTSRVSVDVSGGGIAGVSGGGLDKVVIFARGNPSQGSGEPNEPISVSGPGQLEAQFGSETPIVEYFRQASGNGVGYSQIWGVMPSEESVTDEDVTGGGEGADHTNGSEIANAPLIEDESLITFEDDTGTELTIEFRYETNKDSTNSDFTGLSPDTDTVFINPRTGEWVADAADNYTISYSYNDWQSAFDSATGVIEEQEVGEWLVGVDSESVVNDAITTANPLRTAEWKMVRVFGLARPNLTSEQNTGHINVGDYTDSLDSESAFVFGPTRLEDQTLTVGGAITGLAAGNSIDEPILGDALSGVGSLDQTLNVPDQESLEESQVIPLSNRGAPMIEGNGSTSTDTSWLKTFFSVRVADRLVLAARAVAKATRGQLNSDATETNVEQQLSDEIEDLIGENVLQKYDLPNVQHLNGTN